ncbi:MAG TPA: substrate-binding domain-containing protein [Opitutaceae bacterium]|nr:substrate-binding domain-containing protein [Opitutaceae bacterium]
MRFHSLPSQVADYLRAEIARGRWSDFLPGERSLAVTLRVSRRTLTAALAQLQQAGWVQAEPARGHRILAKPAVKLPASTTRHLGLLTAGPLETLRPGTTLWVNDLQALLNEADFRLNTFHGSKYLAPHPARALAKLTAEHPQSGWILAGCTETTQRWFSRMQIPTLVVGTCHGDVVLPDVDLDFLALGRHVAGRIMAQRHPRTALFLTNAPGYFTSEAETERGFREVVERAGGDVITVYHERTRESLVRVLRRLFDRADPPTALVVSNSLAYLTTTSFLTQRGLKVPLDVSVIARNDDAFMTALLPEPTRYHANPHLLAKRIFKLLMQVVEGQPQPRPHVRIMPEYISGESLGPPRQNKIRP